MTSRALLITGVLTFALAGSASAQDLELQAGNILPIPDETRRQVVGFEHGLRGAIDRAAADLNKRLKEAVPEIEYQLQFQAQTIVNGVVLPDGDAMFLVLIPAIEQTGVKILQANPYVRRLSNNAPLDPNAEYTRFARLALIDAVLDSGMSLTLPADKKLTVIAGELLPQANPFNQKSKQLILQITGADLLALRENRLSRDDAKARIKENRY